MMIYDEGDLLNIVHRLICCSCAYVERERFFFLSDIPVILQTFLNEFCKLHQYFCKNSSRSPVKLSRTAFVVIFVMQRYTPVLYNADITCPDFSLKCMCFCLFSRVMTSTINFVLQYNKTLKPDYLLYNQLSCFVTSLF